MHLADGFAHQAMAPKTKPHVDSLTALLFGVLQPPSVRAAKKHGSLKQSILLAKMLQSKPTVAKLEKEIKTNRSFVKDVPSWNFLTDNHQVHRIIGHSGKCKVL